MFLEMDSERDDECTDCTLDDQSTRCKRCHDFLQGRMDTKGNINTIGPDIQKMLKV